MNYRPSRTTLICTLLLAAGCTPTDKIMPQDSIDYNIPDVVGPRVLSTHPSDTESNVALNHEIIVLFNEPLEISSLTSDSFQVMVEGTPVAGALSFTHDTATFAPTELLSPSTLFDVTLTSGLMDLSGNTLAVPYQWRFSTGAFLDMEAPEILSTNPADGDVDVPVTHAITVLFSEPLAPESVNDATFRLTDNGQPVDGYVSYAGNILTFVPTENLPASTLFDVDLSTGLMDLAHNPLSMAYHWGFRSAAMPDVSAPVALFSAPFDRERDVAIERTVNVVFNERLDPTTVNASTFTLMSEGVPVAGAVSYAGDTATFTPSDALVPSSLFEAAVSTGVMDLAGNPLSVTYIVHFISARPADMEAPTVLSTLPWDGETDVAINRTVNITFSEPLDPVSVNTSTFTVMDGGTPIPGAVTFAGSTATFTPSSDLPVSTVLDAEVTTGLMDVAGNPLAAAYSWQFTSGLFADNSIPEVLSVQPWDGELDVAINRSVHVHFSEPLDPASVNSSTFVLLDGGVPVAGTVSFAGSTATFTPSRDLDILTLFDATVTTGMIDLAGNALASDYSWSFSSAAVADNTAPFVVSTDPYDTEVDIGSYRAISAVFSEPLDADSVTNTTFMLTGDGVPVAGVVSFLDNTATFTPNSDLLDAVLYEATVTMGVYDLAGNYMVQDYVWDFTAVDAIAPSILSVSPYDMETDVALNRTLHVTFSEPLDPLSVTSSSFTLLRDGVPVAGGVSCVSDIIYFNPDVDLLDSSTYDVVVTTGILDLAGNALGLDYIWSFDTVDITAPFVISTTPFDGEIEVLGTQALSVVFSEPLDPASVSAATFTLTGDGIPVAGVVSFVNNIATFTPDSDLLGNVFYEAIITSGIYDLSGNTMAQDYIWDFRAEDTIAPSLLAVSPYDTETRVALNRTIDATFSEALDPLSVTGSSFTLRRNGVPVAGTVSCVDDMAYFNPTVDLLDSSTYEVTVTTGMMDPSGNPLGQDYVWFFDTVDTTAPFVISTTPFDGEIDVTITRSIHVLFSEPLDPLTVSHATFSVMDNGVLVPGVVSYLGNTATFTPSNLLAISTLFDVEIDGMTDLAGNPVGFYDWSFTSNDSGLPVDLGTAGDLVILAKTGISTVITSAITGDIAVSPAAATYITGFSLILDSSNVFSTASQVVGSVFAADYALPTPTVLITAVSDMETAFIDAASRAPDVINLGAGNIGGMTLTPGVYKWSTGLLIPTNITLNGSDTDVWIFEIAQNLNLSNGARVQLAGGALPENIFWQVSGLIDMGTTAHCEGILLSQTSISLRSGASVNGRLFAQSAVTLIANTIVEP